MRGDRPPSTPLPLTEQTRLPYCLRRSGGGDQGAGRGDMEEGVQRPEVNPVQMKVPGRYGINGGGDGASYRTSVYEPP
ncbi:hypothetical protein Pcinc_017545 [Petrolisthes cinctipes]|uniref:Uncharacterized protein n=1 Tax=Petrolisthes cinctipes TaxID=88211 RepID=A0AAE1FQI7_PETCI|nr:hypothetical protein Pcinc_017545 [Petrolisthes cinctipes]